MAVKFRRHMTILQRRQLREAIWAEEVESARLRAEQKCLSPVCKAAMECIRSGRPELAASQHRLCMGEEVGGAGCLCPCHDVIGEGLAAGGDTIPFER